MQRENDRLKSELKIMREKIAKMGNKLEQYEKERKCCNKIEKV